MKKKTKTKGKNITVSLKAYQKIAKEATNADPKRTLREHVNITNNLPAEE